MKRSREDLSTSLMRKLTLRSKETAIQFIKFSLIGCLNSTLHYAVFLLLIRFTGTHYLTASIIGYSVGLLNSFVLNNCWTFAYVKSNSNHYLFGKFVLVNVLSLLLNIITLKYFIDIVLLRPELAQILAIGVSMFTNFLANKFWTFQKP
jgi:putative flippase GtrA